MTNETSPCLFRGCFNPDCNFIITVDSGEGINESSELNNTVDNGTCFG